MRATNRRPTPTVVPGVPLSTSHALDRLGRPDVSSRAVASGLRQYQRIAALSRDVLQAPHRDVTEFIVPGVRAELERALDALPRRAAAPLRAVVARADAEYEARTLHNPGAGPGPWWTQRYHH